MYHMHSKLFKTRLKVVSPVITKLYVSMHQIHHSRVYMSPIRHRPRAPWGKYKYKEYKAISTVGVMTVLELPYTFMGIYRGPASKQQGFIMGLKHMRVCRICVKYRVL